MVAGHINQLCARAAANGIDPFKIIQAACINPVQHYGLDVGLLREGEPADFILVADLKKFDVLQTYINGELVAEKGRSKMARQESGSLHVINNFTCTEKSVSHFEISLQDVPVTNECIPVIEALDGQLITNKLFKHPYCKTAL